MIEVAENHYVWYYQIKMYGSVTGRRCRSFFSAPERLLSVDYVIFYCRNAAIQVFSDCGKRTPYITSVADVEAYHQRILAP